MTNKRNMASSTPPAPRFCLVTPPLSDGALPNGFGAALRDANVAAVLLRLAPADERILINRIKQVAQEIQNSGAALLLDQHVELVARSGADGAHLHGVAALQEVVKALKPDRIAGVGGLKTRDDAMRAGEIGADYVMFGEPSADGWRPAFDAIIDRVTWWTELFEIPCVAYADNLDEVGPLSAAGAEFIGLGASFFSDARGIAAALAEAAHASKAPEHRT